MTIRYKIVMENCLDKRQYKVTLSDEEMNGYYLEGDIKLPKNIPDGEYTLSLYEDEELLAQDLVRVGDYKAEKPVYEKGKTKYIQYK